MILDIYEQVTGGRRPNLLSQPEYGDLGKLYSAYERTQGPTLLIVEPEDLTESLTWLDLEDDVCLTTDPESLVSHRLQALALPDNTQFDNLTSLLHREAFHRVLDLASADPSLSACSVLLADLDHFKRINDQWGHERGDQILQGVADVLQSTCTEFDIAARYDGEAFAILCDRDRDSAEQLSEQIRERVATKFSEPAAALSIGIATAGAPTHANEPTMDPRELLRHADEALFAAKAAGRNTCVHYAQLLESCERSGEDAGVTSLENRARVLSERVTNFVTLKCGKLVNRFRRAADVDSLTQFYSRGYLDRRLAQEVRDSDTPLCVAFADVDHFGDINKQFGWPTGDQVLRDVGKLIRGQLRSSDWVGRYGGEEFCIVMQNTTLDDSVPILDRLRLAIQDHEFRSTHDYPFQVTISIGAVESTQDETHLHLMERACERTLDAKRSGRNCVAV